MRITQRIPEITKNVTANNKQETVNFANQLQEALGDMNTKLHQADEATSLLVRGEMDFHNAMIISEKANLALQLTMAIRNKVIEAYQEVMRMQV